MDNENTTNQIPNNKPVKKHSWKPWHIIIIVLLVCVTIGGCSMSGCLIAMFGAVKSSIDANKNEVEIDSEIEIDNADSKKEDTSLLDYFNQKDIVEYNESDTFDYTIGDYSVKIPNVASKISKENNCVIFSNPKNSFGIMLYSEKTNEIPNNYSDEEILHVMETRFIPELTNRFDSYKPISKENKEFTNFKGYTEIGECVSENQDVNVSIAVICNRLDNGTVDFAIIMCFGLKSVEDEILITADNIANSAEYKESDNYSSTNNSSSGIRPEIKEYLDSYEAFVDEYVDFMKKYSQNPGDLSMMSDYLEFMQKEAEFSEKIDKFSSEDLTPEEYDYYIDVTARASSKMIEVLKYLN